MSAERKHSPTDVEVFYIRENPENLTETQLSEKMGVILTSVKKIFKEKSDKRKVNNEAKPPTATRQMMISETEGKKKGFVTMTSGASEVLDEVRKTRKKIDQSTFLAKTFPEE